MIDLSIFSDHFGFLVAIATKLPLPNAVGGEQWQPNPPLTRTANTGTPIGPMASIAGEPDTSTGGGWSIKIPSGYALASNRTHLRPVPKE